MTADRLARALGYPYPAPDHDFLFDRGEARPLPDSYELSGRTPVLGVGSNRSPEQLARKFADRATIPVTKARMADADVVYGARMTGYGSIPATLHASPGTTVTLAVTWLTDDQLAVMHETELPDEGYAYGAFEPGIVDLGRHAAAAGTGEVAMYVCRQGAMRLDGAPVALAEISAENRRYAALGQAQKLAAVHARHNDGEGFEDWLLAHLDDRPRRLRLRALLEATAEPFSHARFRVIEGA